MTISSTTNRVEQDGNDVTVDIPFPYYFLADTDLKVYVDSTLQTLTTHYTVTGAGNPAGGTVTMVTAPATGETAVVLRDPPLTQTKDWVENDPDPAEEKEEAFDKLTMIVQRLSDLITRSFRLADYDVSGADLTVPTPSADSYLKWNSLGTALVNSIPSASSDSDTINFLQAGTGAVSRSMQDKGRERVTVADYGTDFETGLNAAAAALPSSGGVIDARTETGTKTLTGALFNGVRKPITLLLGKVTLEWDQSTIGHFLHRGTKIIGDGTILQPASAGSASTSTGYGLLNTFVDSTTGSMTAAANTVTVASASDIEVGCVLAVQGAGGSTDVQETTLSSGIDAAVTTVPVASTSGFPSAGDVMIDTEIISYTSTDATNFLGCTRGALGTTAATHTSSTAVDIVLCHRGIVESISGTTVTLRSAENAVTTVSGATVYIGQKGIVIDGDITFNGRQDRAGANPSPNVLGIYAKFASELYVGPNVKFIDIDHGGVQLDNSYKCHIKGRYKGNGRPADNAGSDIWVFRSSRENVIEPAAMDDGYTMVTVDDSTTPRTILDGKSNDNVITLPSSISHERGVVIAGSNRNRVYVPEIDTSAAGSDYAVSITDGEGTNPRTPIDNTVIAGYLKSSSNYVNIEGSNNAVYAQRVSGGSVVASGNALGVQIVRQLYKSVAIDFPSLTAGSRNNQTTTVTGAQVGDEVSITCDHSAGAWKGVTLIAWVSAADTVTIEAYNTTAAGTDPPSTTFTIVVRGGFS